MDTQPTAPLYEPVLDAIIDTAFQRLHDTLLAAGPTIAARTHQWMESLGGVARQKDGYKHPLSYPMVLLAWWAEKALHDPPDPDLQNDLVYSTICGYYAIRLIDNLMDGHGAMEREILPVLHVLSAEFQGVYQRRFPNAHPFWSVFRDAWYHTAECTLRDAEVDDIDLDHFMQVTARKTQAVKVPIAALCYAYARPERIDRWARFVDLFGCWHQMSNDLFDWRKDLGLGTCTCLLSEARRRSAPGEPVIQWIAREGFAWAMQRLTFWMSALQDQAGALGSPDLLAYLEFRDQMLRQRQEELAPGLNAAAQLFGILSRGTEMPPERSM